MKYIETYRLPERITAIFLGVMCSFYLLYVDKSGYLQIVHAKSTAFFWISGGYVLLMALCGVFSAGKAKLNIGQMLRKASHSQWLLCGYLLFTVLSTLLSDYRQESLFGMKRKEGLLAIGLYVLCFLLVSIFGKPGKWMLYLFGGTMTLFCLLCLVQLRGENPFGLYPQGLTYLDRDKKYSGAFLGTIGNVDLVAALLCVAIPIFFISLMRLRGRPRFILLLPLALCAGLLVQMDVQAGLVGVFGGCILLLPVVLPVKKTTKRKMAGCIGGLCIAGLTVLWLYDFGGTGTLYEAHALLHGNFQDNHGSGRIFIWRNVLQLVPEAPLFGGGPDTLSLRLNAQFERYDPSLKINIIGAIDVAHNEYLNILVNQGVFALAAYLAALGTSLVRWLRSGQKKAAAAICGGSVLCYCIQAFFGISMPLTAPYFWLIWGLLERMQREHTNPAIKRFCRKALSQGTLPKPSCG